MHNFKISTKTVEVQRETDGMGINTHKHHVGTIQQNVECKKVNINTCQDLIFIVRAWQKGII
jgi:GTP:adenosylcobinamide-phosphate guanylyltransferase